ncbi:hypothetical protein QTP86_014317, partial [Hemibagrus guttatus]
RVLEAVDALHAAASPALFTTLVGERRRKRPRCCEDHEEHGRTEAPGGDMSNDADGVMQGTEDECVSGKATLPDDNEDGPCEFNSFQFWRTPLPALDLSLLDAPFITELSEDSSLKDSTEDMET